IGGVAEDPQRVQAADAAADAVQTLLDARRDGPVGVRVGDEGVVFVAGARRSWRLRCDRRAGARLFGARLSGPHLPSPRRLVLPGPEPLPSSAPAAVGNRGDDLTGDSP